MTSESILREFVILCEDALCTRQALQVEVAVGLGSAGGYSALAPHGPEARPYPVIRRYWCSSRRGLHSNGRSTHPRSSPLNPRTQAQDTNLVFACANDKPRHRTRIAAPLARGDAVPRARTQTPLPRGTAASLPRTWTQAPLPRLGLKQRLEPNNSTN